MNVCIGSLALRRVYFACLWQVHLRKEVLPQNLFRTCSLFLYNPPHSTQLLLTNSSKKRIKSLDAYLRFLWTGLFLSMGRISASTGAFQLQSVEFRKDLVTSTMTPEDAL